jgi:ABC-type nitrate/sulfonate/bicarbonate transport system permease component
MADQPQAQSPPLPGGTGPVDPWPARQFRNLFALRRDAPLWQTILCGVLAVLAVLAVWWYVTRGEPEERIVSPAKGLPSPAETFSSFHSLWFDRELTRNIWASLRRVVLGFGLATLVGVPVGVLCGCFSRVNAFFLPLTVFGRNIPIAALIPLTFSLFGTDEFQKVMFIFIACVAFIISDAARAVQDVGMHYVDTAYTLGAKRWQVILKVLVPLALPSIFNSLRLLFGLAFGYIMLAEVITTGGEAGGLGHIIIVSQRLRNLESSGHILLILLVIPLVALAIDRLLFWVQRQLFPHRYGGPGILNQGVRAVLHGWDDVKGLLRRPAEPPGPAARTSGTPVGGHA